MQNSSAKVGGSPHQGERLFDNLNEWLSVKQVTENFPISKSMLYKYKYYGIPARKLFGKLVFKREEIEEWLERWAA